MNKCDISKTQDILTKERIIFFNKEVDTDTIYELIQKIMYLENLETKDIYLYISSPGGHIYSFFCFYDVMNNIKSKIHTVVLGYAMSAGALMALSGTGSRSIFKNALMLLHQPRSSMSEKTTLTSMDMEIQAEHMKLLRTRLNDICLSKTKITREQIDVLMSKDSYLTAEQSLELGLVDRIIDSTNTKCNLFQNTEENVNESKENK